jgi:very-short-patch-repair endonuclease
MITGPVRSVKLARKLRSEMSLPEIILWREFRKRPSGLKIRRQHPAGHYVLDFYCATARLAIEIDGAGHDGEEAARYDARRSAFLKSQGVATLRVPAKAVLENLEGALARIVEVCLDRVGKVRARGSSGDHLPLHHPADGSPPPVGEDLQ